MLNYRNADQSEFLTVYDFVTHCEGLENYYPHFYKIMLRYFGSNCFIAEENKQIVGFVLGFLSNNYPNTYFLWQIGVDPKRQGQGIGKTLLRFVEQEIKKIGGDRIEATIAPENIPSQKAFERNGYINISQQVGETVTVQDNMAVKDHYSPGRHFMVYEKKI
jgi:diaminobutyrate acetyltransferase